MVAFTALVTSVIAQSVHPEHLILLATTTARDSGILRVLTDAFARKSGSVVKTITGTSEDSLAQGSRGEGDVLLTHSPEAEKAWMAEGNGTSRRLVMYDDFVIIGPRDDPAKIRELKTADALRRIAETKTLFLSRGDHSGTHKRELALWKRAGVEPKGQSWYRESGKGQGLNMEMASQLRAYTFTDRGTYQGLALVLVGRIDLRVLVEKDPLLYNTYHVMPVNPAKFPKVNASAGQAFADWVVSPEGQDVIARFGKREFGRSLFVPAANMREEDFGAQDYIDSSFDRRPTGEQSEGRAWTER